MGPTADLEDTRAALAPMLEATAGILPWLATPRPPRFPPAVARRWDEAGRRLAGAWSDRHAGDPAEFRAAVFALLAAAIETADVDSLALAEALADAADRLEDPVRQHEASLLAAISAAAECLADKDGIEHPAFPERARHFTVRLARCSDSRAPAPARSPVIDRIFAGEAGDCIDRIRDALAALPPDGYAIRLAVREIAALAQPLESTTIALLAGRLEKATAHAADLEAAAPREEIERLLAILDAAIAKLSGDSA